MGSRQCAKLGIFCCAGIFNALPGLLSQIDPEIPNMFSELDILALKTRDPLFTIRFEELVLKNRSSFTYDRNTLTMCIHLYTTLPMIVQRQNIRSFQR